MGIVASYITSLTIVYTTVYSDTDQSKHQSCASLAFVWGIHRGPVNSPHKWPVTRKMFPFDDVIMYVIYWSFIYILWYFSIFIEFISYEIAKTLGSMSITLQADRYPIDIDPRVIAIWDVEYFRGSILLI